MAIYLHDRTTMMMIITCFFYAKNGYKICEIFFFNIEEGHDVFHLSMYVLVYMYSCGKCVVVFDDMFTFHYIPLEIKSR